jgi:hypothetical protein
VSQFSDYIEPLILNAVFNSVALDGAVDQYIALYTVTPSDAGGGTEVTGGSYARLSVDANSGAAPKWALAVADGVGHKVSNANTFTFAQATVGWGAVLAFGVFDHLTTGNLLMWGPLDATKTVGINDTLSFAIDGLKLRVE